MYSDKTFKVYKNSIAIGCNKIWKNAFNLKAENISLKFKSLLFEFKNPKIVFYMKLSDMIT